MNLKVEVWNQPQICEDCHAKIPRGYQELLEAANGLYLEKRCAVCAAKHYGKEAIDQLEEAPTAKEQRKAAPRSKESAPLLDAGWKMEQWRNDLPITCRKVN